MNPVLVCFLMLAGGVLGWAAVEIVLALRRITRALESGSLIGPAGTAGPRGIPGIQGETGSPGKDAVLPPHLMLQSPPAATSHGMARVMRLEGSNWVAGEWVREHTQAWQTAWDTPGVALLPQVGEIQLGNQ